MIIRWRSKLATQPRRWVVALALHYEISVHSLFVYLFMDKIESSWQKSRQSILLSLLSAFITCSRSIHEVGESVNFKYKTRQASIAWLRYFYDFTETFKGWMLKKLHTKLKQTFKKSSKLHFWKVFEKWQSFQIQKSSLNCIVERKQKSFQKSFVKFFKNFIF